MLSFKVKLPSAKETRLVSLAQVDVKSLRAGIVSLFPDLKSCFKLFFYDKNHDLKAVISNADLLFASHLVPAPTLHVCSNNDKFNMETLRSEMLKAVMSFKEELRHVDTRVVSYPVVHVPDAHPHLLGKVIPQELMVDHITQMLWNRVRQGPSPLEDPIIRKTIVENDFKLRHVEPNLAEPQTVTERRRGHDVIPRINNKMVNILTMEECKKMMHRELFTFHKKPLSPANPTTSDPVLESPEPMHKIVDQMKRNVIKAIGKFEKRNLNKIMEPLEVEPDAPPAPVAPPPPVPKATQSLIVPQSQFQQNLNQLYEMGFTDRKMNISALIATHNNLEEAILAFLGAD